MNAIPTLKKISEHLNISISTVSRALKDHPDVSAETIRRVKELADMLEYEPNAFAVNLRKRKSDTYAILVPEISGFFYHSFIQSVEEEARRKGFGVMILQSMDKPDIEDANLKICRYNHVAGIFLAISSQTKDYSAFKKTEEAGIPIVFFDKVPAGDAFATISVADVEAGKQAAIKIEESRKKHICCILGSPDISITKLREKGFLDQWRTTHTKDPLMYYADNEDAAFQYVMKLGKKGIKDTAIFCMSDQVLGGVMRALYQLDSDIPKDVSVLAMSNGFLPRFFKPEVSYIETNGYQLGKLGIRVMEQRQQGADAVAIKEMMECTFYAGGSL